jgi:hypothetical protein
MMFNGAVSTRNATTSPGRYAGMDNGWVFSLVDIPLTELDTLLRRGGTIIPKNAWDQPVAALAVSYVLPILLLPIAALSDATPRLKNVNTDRRPPYRRPARLCGTHVVDSQLVSRTSQDTSTSVSWRW